MDILSKFFRKGYNRIRVEGLQLNKFLSSSLNNNFHLTRIKKIDDFTLECNILQKDYKKLSTMNHNQYRITLLTSKGIPEYRRKILSNKAFVLGFFLFAFLLYYQGQFINEIHIKGIEQLDENQLIHFLSDMGVNEGNKKNFSTDEIKSYLYDEYENISWAGVSYTGNKLTIEIVEKVKAPEIIPMNIPCDIVAKKKGYIENVITKYGTRVVQDDVFVNEGDLLIEGIIKKINTSGRHNESFEEIKYVHALGEVYARTIYRFIILEEKTEYIKIHTGKKDYGFNLKVGDILLDTGKMFVGFDRYKRVNSKIFETRIPFPIALYCAEYSEVEIETRTKSQEEIENSINEQVESIIKKNIPEDAKISNKDLMFTQIGNIIKVEIMIEAIEDIGVEKRIENI